MENVLAVYNRPVKVNRTRLSFDERPCQLLDGVVSPLPLKPGKAAKEDNEYVRQGTAVVLLAYDLDTGIATRRSVNDERKGTMRSSCNTLLRLIMLALSVLT